MKDIGYPSTRGCRSPMNWEIDFMGCSIAVSWFGMRRMQRGRLQRTPLRKRSSNGSMFSPTNS